MSFFNRLFKGKQEEEIQVSEIVPVLRTVPPGEGAPMEIPEEDRPVVQPYVADILVCYAVDKPTMLQFISPRICADLGIEPSDLRRIAMTNLGNKVPSLEVSTRNAPFYQVVNLLGFESAALIAKSFWDDMAPTIQGDIIAAAPGRDTLLFTGTGVPGAPDMLREFVKELYPKMERPLTRHLLIRRERKWEVYEKDSIFGA